ncbi:hypothetical protein AB0C51_20380 [Streptomyces pathocidini]|uniref:hypothetical protein n=1 Tax=Streptomyces pathocidini TaxID=1650571 RepID=UPI00340F13D1
MTTWWFPDNTVLCNFAAVERLDVLEKVLDSRGRWTEAVAFEARRSARHLRDLTTVFADGWLGEPVEISRPADVRRVETIRRAVFGGVRGRPLQHLGEAQTCHVIEQWDEFHGAHWISDDRDAFQYARRRGIRALQTTDLVHIAATRGILPPPDGHALLTAMVTAGRRLHHFPPKPNTQR